jgi:hypothetical protein
MTDTLKSICEQCPHLNNPQLDFIPTKFPRHKETILRDLQELVIAASSELEKTVVILSGSILEAVLYSFIQAQQDYIVGFKGSFTFRPKDSLENFIRTFNGNFGKVLPGVALPDSVIDYRNVVHFNREINSAHDICVRGSREMLRILDALLGELEQFAGPVPAE